MNDNNSEYTFRLSKEKYRGFLKNLIDFIRLDAFSSIIKDVSRSEFMLLAQAADYPCMHNGVHITVADAAASIEVSSSAISRTLGGLLEKDLVEREFDKNDRRNVRIVVNEKGKNVLDNFVNEAFMIIDQALKEFSDEETELLRELQNRFIRSLCKVINERR
ncbi:MAG: MarR family winged helix-turn-helix transcriptional regulator [Oscillospiraceae bacterium]